MRAVLLLVCGLFVAGFMIGCSGASTPETDPYKTTNGTKKPKSANGAATPRPAAD